FPVLSETFVLNQVAAMVKSGFEVKVVSFSPEKSGRNHPWVKKHSLMERLTTAYTSSERKNKIIDFIFCFLSDFLKLKWNRLIWITKSGINGYMLGRCFEGVEGPIVCHFGPMGAELAKLLEEGVIKNVDIITIFHGYDMSVYAELEREKENYSRLFRLGHLMLPVSYYWKERLINLGCSSEKISVHRMGVDVDDFKFISRYDDLNRDVINLISVCRFVEKKGIPVLLGAIKELPKRYRLTLVGGGPLHQDVLNLVKNFGLEDRVSVKGSLPSNIVAEKLNEADAFVLPSITASNGDMEGIPVALMEAMASGLLVFSSFHSGIPELIEHGKSGFLSDEGDIIALKNNILYAFEELNGSQRQSIADTAEKVIKANFNLKILNGDLQELLFPISDHNEK
ncbi:glycosyltransferase, partial [Vibrio sp. M260118]|uniref:glycosyltransferase n=1 Tax=Vibrio sp. M260118 TaxID=3020896 RepID=UPI002F412080